MKRLLALLLIICSPVLAQTTGNTINSLTAAGTLTGAELFPVWQNNATKRASINQINLTQSIPVTNGDCIVGVGGNWVAGSCSGPSGSGTVNAGTLGQIGYYASSSNSISGTNALPNGTTATTQSPGDTSTKITTDAFVAASFAPLASPTFTGAPKTPTASPATGGTQIASQAYVDARVLTGQSFTTSGTFTPTRGGTYKITITGGGGGGGYGNNAASGGGGGGTAIIWANLTASTGYTVTVGTGGGGGTNGSPTGGNGVDSTVVVGATTYTGGGGIGGGSGAVLPSTGGSATNGAINSPGGDSTASYSTEFSGTGGASFWGGGGYGVTNGYTTAGHAGEAYGSGGGGGLGSVSGTSNGGVGAGGIITFEWVS